MRKPRLIIAFSNNNNNSSMITFWYCGSHASQVVNLLSYWTLHSHTQCTCNNNATIEIAAAFLPDPSITLLRKVKCIAIYEKLITFSNNLTTSSIVDGKKSDKLNCKMCALIKYQWCHKPISFVYLKYEDISINVTSCFSGYKLHSYN